MRLATGIRSCRPPRPARLRRATSWVREDITQHARSRARSRRWIARGGPLPSGSSGGLAVADPAGTFVYADSGGNAFTFAAGATSFGTGSGSRGSLADLKIVPGLAVMLAAGAVSAEAVS